MPLLDVLPEEVENSLRELRQTANGSGSALSATPAIAHPTGIDPTSDSRTDANGSAILQSGNHKPVQNGVAEVVPRSVSSEPGNGNGHYDTTIPDAESNSDNETANEIEIPERLVFATDLTHTGAFGPEWLVVENEQVYVFAPNGGNKAKLRHVVPLAKIKEAKADAMIGNGVVEVRTEEETIPLVRFSQASVGDASAIARQIDALAKGEPLPTLAEDDKPKTCPTCGRPLPKNNNVCEACLDKRAVMLRLFRFLAPYKKQVGLGVACLIGTTLLDLAPPYIGGRIIDTLTRQSAAHNVTMAPLIGLVALLAIARIFHAGFVYGQRRVNPWLGGRIVMDIRMALYHKFNQLSLSYYDKRSTGSVMSRVTNDADNLWDFLSDGIPWLVSNLLTLFGIGFILFGLNWQLALLMLTPGPFIFGLTRWFMPRARRKFHHVWHRISRMYSTLNSTLTGMRVVKAFAQEDREVTNFRKRNQAIFEASYSANAFRATFWPLLGLLMSAGAYIIWLGGGYQVLHGFTVSGHLMSLGILVMFNGYLMQFYQPFMNFSQVLDWSTRSLTAAERVFEVLDTEPDIREAQDAVAMPDMQGAVEFDHVTFTYDKAKQVLQDFTLKVEPGEMIGLVGHSGAGKSTIINLLSRFYDPTEGAIKVDGINIKNIRREDFRGQFGIVLQEPYLFPGTIRDNIAYAKPEATIDEIMRAAKAANCHEFILKFPDGYDTQAGERGQRLSGGERQRISIARAILHNPKILILDEATASVDTETEKLIQEAINRLIENRTTFAIAHRLSTLRHASRLVVMKEGKMVESGTHEELMELDGEYAKLVKIQTEVNELRGV